MSGWRVPDNPLRARALESPLLPLAPLAVLFALGAGLRPGPAHSVVGVLLVAAGAVLGLLVGERLGVLYTLAAFVAFEVAFRNTSGVPATLPVELLRPLVRVIAVPLLVHACLPSPREAPRRLALWQLYLPLVVALPLTMLATVRALSTPPAPLPGMAAARLVYGLFYLTVLLLVLLSRPRAPVAEKAGRERAADLERDGRFALAGRLHAREGRPAQGAQAAERGGDLALAARLYREAGDPLKAGDMYYRSGDLEEAARQYRQADAQGAVARVYQEMGRVEDAAAAFEKAGNLEAAARAIEDGGGRPGAELLYRAGRVREAVAAWEAEGSPLRAAEVFEQDLGDLPEAARCYLLARQPRRAGELLERLGRREEAIDAFCFAPDGWFDALRLIVEAGELERAEAMLAQAPAGVIETLEGERELLTLARLHERAGRGKAAISLLQKARRLETGSGAIHLMLGRLLLADGLAELAEPELRTASELPLDAAQQTEAAYLLGCVLDALGRQAEARDVFAELAQKDLSYRDVEERYRRLRAAFPTG